MYFFLYLSYWFKISMTDETHRCLEVNRVKSMISFFFRWFPDNLSFEDLKLPEIYDQYNYHTLVLGRKGGAVFKEVLVAKKVLVAKIARGNTPEAIYGELASEFDLNRRGHIL